MFPFQNTIFNECPGGLCTYLQKYSEVLLIVLVLEALIFLITLFPPLFSWSNKKPDGKKRITFAVFACITFYFWLVFLALNSVYCFGFLAHAGPCKHGHDGGTSGSGVGSSAGGGGSGAGTPAGTSSVPSVKPFILTNSESASGKSSSRVPPSSAASSLTSSPLSSSSSDTTTTVTTGGSPAGLSSTSSQASSPIDSFSSSSSSMSSPSSLASFASSSSSSASSATSSLSSFAPSSSSTEELLLPSAQALIWRTGNESCTTPITEHEADLRNITIVNILIIVLLLIVLIANAKEALNAKALHFKETLCKKEDVQKFLSTLVMKPPEVGHYVSCFHPAKAPDVKTNATRKVVTFSAIENFEFQSWRDFSNLGLIDPSMTYPIMEIQIVLNFFPGDHYTAERYKNFVMALTKEHSGKDNKINIDDYFHIEDHREWTFFIGNSNYISPWWDHGAARIILSCLLLFGWPLRMGYSGQIAKHQIEVKKAVFCENNPATDEGVSMSDATGSNGAHNNAADSNAKSTVLADDETANKEERAAPIGTAAAANASGEDAAAAANNVEIDEADDSTTAQLLPQNQQRSQVSPIAAAAAAAAINKMNSDPGYHSASTSSNGCQRQQQQQQQQQQPPSHLDIELRRGVGGGGQYSQQQQQQQHHHQQLPLHQPNQISHITAPIHSTAAAHAQGHYGGYGTAAAPLMRPLVSPRTQLREATKDIVTAVTHQDINGVSAVNTVAVKDIDVQMTAVSGYETYV